MKNNSIAKCDYSNHDFNYSQDAYFCFSCKKRICSNCFIKHKSNNEYNNHNIILFKDAVEAAKKKERNRKFTFPKK